MGRPIGFAKRTASSFLVSKTARGLVNYTHKPMRPSKQMVFAASQLESAGFKIGPGVDLKLKP
jgi:hypothetical protein